MEGLALLILTSASKQPSLTARGGVSVCQKECKWLQGQRSWQCHPQQAGHERNTPLCYLPCSCLSPLLPASGISHGCPAKYSRDHGAVRLVCPRGEPGWFDKLATSGSTQIPVPRDFCLSCLPQTCEDMWLPWRQNCRSDQQSRADGVHSKGSCYGGGTTGHSCPAGVQVHIPCKYAGSG